VLPPALAVLASFPNADWKLLLPVCTFCGLLLLLAQVGRDRGKLKEEELFSSWGGKPTTVLLRHRDSPFDEATLAQLHAWLASVTGVPAPSKRKEAANPTDADEVYEAYVRRLRDATRDKQQYPLVFEENVNYGFRRNTWGLRPFGILLAVVGVLGGGFNVYRYAGGGDLGLAAAVSTVNALLLGFWVFWVRPAWVRIPAQAYAERLMEAALQMLRPFEPDAQPRQEPIRVE
jgi:hypothetical protein